MQATTTVVDRLDPPPPFRHELVRRQCQDAMRFGIERSPSTVDSTDPFLPSVHHAHADEGLFMYSSCGSSAAPITAVYRTHPSRSRKAKMDHEGALIDDGRSSRGVCERT